MSLTSDVLARHRSSGITRAGRSSIAVIAFMALAGCASTSSGGLVSSVAVDDVRASAPQTPESVRWGGTIASIDNAGDGTTTLEIVSRPLASNGRPVRNDDTDGRFLAEVNEVLDPAIVKAGRDITVTGLVGEVRDGRIGASPYVFPVVDVADYQYWPQRTVGHNTGYYSPYAVGLAAGVVGLTYGGIRGHLGFRGNLGHRGHRGLNSRGFRGHRGFRSNRGFRTHRGFKSSRGLRSRGFGGRRGGRGRH